MSDLIYDVRQYAHVCRLGEYHVWCGENHGEISGEILGSRFQSMESLMMSSCKISGLYISDSLMNKQLIVCLSIAFVALLQHF